MPAFKNPGYNGLQSLSNYATYPQQRKLRSHRTDGARILGTFRIIKLSRPVFHLSGKIMRNVNIIRRNSTVGGRSPETLSAGIKRTAGSHPKARVSGDLPAALAHTCNSQDFLDPKLSAKCSALSAAYLRWAGSLRSALFPAKVCRRQGLDIRDRSESANLRITRLTVSVNLSVSDYTSTDVWRHDKRAFSLP